MARSGGCVCVCAHTMSLRRVDDNDASALSIDAAIGALADRLPVATRLNHVLTIGAKLRLEQQNKQQSQPKPQQLQSHKSVFTSAYPRWAYRYAGWSLYENCRFRPGPNSLFRMRLDAYKNAMNDFGNNQTSPVAQQNAIIATKDLVTVVRANQTPTRKAIDLLREEDCYVALNYIVNTAGSNAPSYRWAVFMMRESLHHDRTMAYTDHPNPANEIYNMTDGQCLLSDMFLTILGGADFRYVRANYPAFAGTPAQILKEQKKWTDEMCLDGLEREENEMDPPVLAPSSLAQIVDQQLEQQQQNAANPAGPSFLGGSDGHTQNVWGISGRRNPDRQYRGG